MVKNKHDSRLDTLILHPSLIGLENIIVAAKEVNLLNSASLVAQPDIIFINNKGLVYVVEYKSNNKHKRTAERQLETAASFIYDAYGRRVKKIYVHGEYEVQEVG